MKVFRGKYCHILSKKGYIFNEGRSAKKEEKALWVCKNREKMAGGFRNEKGRQMYFDIISFIETVKRKKKNIFQNIVWNAGK